MNTTLLVIGLGNPIMGDDGVGIYVVRHLRDNLASRRGVEFKELSLGGLRLIEELLGYEKAFIIDSIATDGMPGKISELNPGELDSRYTGSPHGTNFATALELYRKLRAQYMPKTIRIFTISIHPDYAFTETLSLPVKHAAEKLLERVANEIEADVAP